MRIKILGQLWGFYRRHLKNDWGYCSNPDEPNKRIVIHKKLKGKKELEIIIHECRHAADWARDEKYIAQEAKDLAEILWKLGYRKTK